VTPATVGGGPVAPARTERVRVTLTDDHEEVDAALRLAHDGFVAAGFMRPRPSGRRMLPQFLNPGTAFLLARVDGVVRGTVTLVADGPFGLPAERAFAEEIDALRLEGPPVFEIGSLVLDPRRPRLHGPVMWALAAAMVRVQVVEHPDSPAVVAASPTARRFYAAIGGLRPVTRPRPLLGAPAVLLQTTARHTAEILVGGECPSRRRMARLVNGSAMSWLSDRRTGRRWPSEWLGPMLDELGVRSRLAAQLRLALDGGELVPGARTRLAVAAPA
jgi:hypothetical protein